MLDITTNPNNRLYFNQQPNALALSTFPANSDLLNGAIEPLNIPGYSAESSFPNPTASSFDQQTQITDFIVGFRVGVDRIGLAGGLNATDVDLQYVTNVTVLFGYDAPESFQLFTPPGTFDPKPIQSQGTLIKVRNSGDIVGFVEDVRVAELQGSIISAQGF